MQHHKVIISDDAQEMVKEHVSFLSQISVNAAKRLRKEIMAGIRSLAYMPERFPYLDPDQQAPGYRKMLVMGRYLALYLVLDGIVYVEYIVDGRQDYQWLLP